MTKIAFFNRNVLFLVCSTLLINCFFLWTHNPVRFMLGLSVPHAEVAYQIVVHNTIKVNKDRIKYILQKQTEGGQVIDYADIDHTKFGPACSYRDVYDTIGYGLLLGLLWKITGSMRYRDVQYLQVIVFSLLMILVYQLMAVLFSDVRVAFCGTASLVSFFPLTFLNCMPLRDIWGWYALVFCFFGIIAFWYGRIGIAGLLGSGFCVSICQGIRPSILPAFLLSLLVIIGYGLVTPNKRKCSGIIVITYLLTNMLGFWVPFLLYNKRAYNQFFVAPVGISLLEGLGEDPHNPWGYKKNDAWYAHFMKKTYGLEAGTPACEEQGRLLFLQCVHERPWYYLRQVVGRIPSILFPILISYLPLYDTYNTIPSFWQRCKVQIRAWGGRGDLMLHYLLIVLFFLLAYGGIVLALRKHLFAVLLLGTGYLPAFGFIFSHVEGRLIVLFAGILSCFVGYALIYLYDCCYKPAFQAEPCLTTKPL